MEEKEIMIVLLCKIEDGVYKYQELPAKIVDNIILPFGWIELSRHNNYSPNTQ